MKKNDVNIGLEDFLLKNSSFFGLVPCFCEFRVRFVNKSEWEISY